MTSFPDWLAAKLGTRQWVVATRLTPRLRDRGYTVALSQKRYSALQLEWERETYGAFESVSDYYTWRGQK